MARTHSFWAQDTPFPDGVVFVGPHKFTTTSGASTLGSTGHGNLTLNIAASETDVLIATLDDVLALRTGTPDFIEEQFGSQEYGPGDFTGYPPLPTSQLGTVVPLGPGYKKKGFKVLDVTPVYSISGAALTAHTLGLTNTEFANNAAPVVTNLIAQGANGLATATQAEPYVTKVSVPTPVFVVSDLTQYQLELDVTTAASGTYSLYGAFIHLAFNYN